MGLDNRNWVPPVAGTAAASLYFFFDGPKYLRTFDWRSTVKVVPPPTRNGPRDGDGDGGGGGSWGNGSENDSSGMSEMVEAAALGVIVTVIVYMLMSGRRGSSGEPVHA